MLLPYEGRKKLLQCLQNQILFLWGLVYTSSTTVTVRDQVQIQSLSISFYNLLLSNGKLIMFWWERYFSKVVDDWPDTLLMGGSSTHYKLQSTHLSRMLAITITNTNRLATSPSRLTSVTKIIDEQMSHVTLSTDFTLMNRCHMSLSPQTSKGINPSTND